MQFNSYPYTLLLIINFRDDDGFIVEHCGMMDKFITIIAFQSNVSIIPKITNVLIGGERK